jgi:hypothetical protein
MDRRSTCWVHHLQLILCMVFRLNSWLAIICFNLSFFYSGCLFAYLLFLFCTHIIYRFLALVPHVSSLVNQSGKVPSNYSERDSNIPQITSWYILYWLITKMSKSRRVNGNITTNMNQRVRIGSRKWSSSENRSGWASCNDTVQPSARKIRGG